MRSFNTPNQVSTLLRTPPLVTCQSKPSKSKGQGVPRAPVDVNRGLVITSSQHALDESEGVHAAAAGGHGHVDELLGVGVDGGPEEQLFQVVTGVLVHLLGPVLAGLLDR